MSLAYRYTFVASVPLDEVEASLTLAVLAIESIYGEAQTLLDAAHGFDPGARQLLIDASTEVGRDLNRIFAGYLRREFGAEAFSVLRADQPTVRQAIPA